MANIERQTWDIFCRVVDNYGDIGVCWRLARQLANEYPFEVRLWVDDLRALKQIWPTAMVCNQQVLDKVDVRVWAVEFEADVVLADVVIEAFACDIPESYLKAMKHKVSQPRWFNLEYLSAEDWVEGCHGLTSVHPQLGLKKTFFFPGVTAKTGGLLKEQGLLSKSDEFQSSEQAKRLFLRQLGVQLPADALVISLFGYENRAVASLLQAWIESPKSIVCLVPPGKILPDVSQALGKSLTVGERHCDGSLELHIVPFLDQSDYDRLLWACDINFVRGEDSFIRAQWAGKPFVWHIYPQDEDFHMVKLDAFLQRYAQTLNEETRTAITLLWHQWNRGSDCAEAWHACLANLQNWQNHGRRWRKHLNSLGDLASNMVHFCQKTL
jgi:uncharacterized repeat protein (TIGR03837 family)